MKTSSLDQSFSSSQRWNASAWMLSLPEWEMNRRGKAAPFNAPQRRASVLMEATVPGRLQEEHKGGCVSAQSVADSGRRWPLGLGPRRQPARPGSRCASTQAAIVTDSAKPANNRRPIRTLFSPGARKEAGPVRPRSPSKVGALRQLLKPIRHVYIVQHNKLQIMGQRRKSPESAILQRCRRPVRRAFTARTRKARWRDASPSVPAY